MKSSIYSRTVHYHETDRMQVVHHSNYIRWMEEIRVAFMIAQNMPYDKMEAEGIMLPLIGVSCQYHIPFQFGETFYAHCRLIAYNGVKLTLSYEIYKEGCDRCCVAGTTQHCFTNTAMKPIRLQKQRPDLHEQFCAMLETE